MIGEVQRAKTALRRQVRERLDRLTGQQRSSASVEICSRLRRQSVWQASGPVLFFAPMAVEPDIWPLCEAALGAGQTVALPRFAAATGDYRAARIQNLKTDVRPGHFGIREPAAGCAELPMEAFALVLVPGVAFDLAGHRLGRGRGDYDRLLARARGVKVGVAFDEQLVEAVPTETLDVRLDFILTPTRWVKAEGQGKLRD